jgi:peptidoglycan/LPS O-acetylase OafA/YrhL
MTMGRSVLPPPEDADSWGEYRARLELERAAGQSLWTPAWWAIAGALFAAALLSCAYAINDHRWWLWLIMLAALGFDGVLAVRAAEHADRERARAVQLGRLEDAWLDHLETRSPQQ